MHTPCGHLFEFSAIVSWLVTQRTCPICRRALSPEDLTFNPVVSTIRDALNFNNETDFISVGTSTEDLIPPPLPLRDPQFTLRSISEVSDYVPSLLNINLPGFDDAPFDFFAPRITHLNPPFVFASDDEVSAADLLDNQVDYVGRDSLINIRQNPFNPSSSNQRVAPIVHRLNLRFLIRLQAPLLRNLYCVIRKYSYQHRSDSLVEVARHLALQGYYVYDLFHISERNGLHQYCLYSMDRLVTGSTNSLSIFVRNPCT